MQTPTLTSEAATVDAASLEAADAASDEAAPEDAAADAVELEEEPEHPVNIVPIIRAASINAIDFFMKNSPLLSFKIRNGVHTLYICYN
jgi:hypothetical protein